MHSIDFIKKVMFKDPQNPHLKPFIDVLTDEEYEELQAKVKEEKWKLFRKNAKVSVIIPYAFYKTTKVPKECEVIVTDNGPVLHKINRVKYYWSDIDENQRNAGMKLSTGSILVFVEEKLKRGFLDNLLKRHFEDTELVLMNSEILSIRKINALKIGLFSKDETLEEWSFRGYTVETGS